MNSLLDQLDKLNENIEYVLDKFINSCNNIWTLLFDFSEFCIENRVLF